MTRILGEVQQFPSDKRQLTTDNTLLPYKGILGYMKASTLTNCPAPCLTATALNTRLMYNSLFISGRKVNPVLVTYHWIDQ